MRVIFRGRRGIWGRWRMICAASCIVNRVSQIFQWTLVLFDPCLIRVFFLKKLEVFFFENRGLFFTYYIYIYL